MCIFLDDDEWILNEVNEPWMTTLRLGKYEIKTKDMKSFLELIEALDGKYKNKLFIKTLIDIEGKRKWLEKLH